jgi:hypothetical protein
MVALVRYWVDVRSGGQSDTVRDLYRAQGDMERGFLD